MTREEVQKQRQINLDALRRADRALIQKQHAVIEARVHPYRDSETFRADRAVLRDLYDAVRNCEVLLRACDRILEDMT